MVTSDENPFASPQTAPEPIAVDTVAGMSLASREQRFWAAAIDVVIHGVCYVPLYLGAIFLIYPGYFADIGFGEVSPEEYARRTALAKASTPSVWFEVSAAVIELAIYLAINGYLLATRGQTVGKKPLAIRVVRKDRSRASLGQLIGLRVIPFWVLCYLPQPLVFVGLMVCVAECLFIFRRSRKCLHDDLAGTVVVNTVTSPPISPPLGVR